MYIYMVSYSYSQLHLITVISEMTILCFSASHAYTLYIFFFNIITV